jgi:hypothetical protein
LSSVGIDYMLSLQLRQSTSDSYVFADSEVVTIVVDDVVVMSSLSGKLDVIKKALMERYGSYIHYCMSWCHAVSFKVQIVCGYTPETVYPLHAMKV